MPENNKPVQSIDYLEGRLGGTIIGDFQDIKDQYGDTPITMKTPEEYWGDESVRAKFGNDKDLFDGQYNMMLRDLSNYKMQRYNTVQTERRTAFSSHGRYAGIEQKQDMWSIRPEKATKSGATQMFGEWTEQTRDMREADFESNHWFDKDGERHALDRDQTYFDLIKEEDYTDEEGNRITGFVFNQQDPYYRGDFGMQAVYEGDYSKHAGDEWLTYWANYGATDFEMESNWYDAIPRAGVNFFFGLVEGIGVLGASLSGIVSEDAEKFFQDEWVSFGKSMQIDQSLESKEAGAFGTVDNALGLVGDVVAYLAAGKAAGSAAMNFSRWMRAGGKTGVTGGRAITGLQGMTPMGGELFGSSRAAKALSAMGYTELDMKMAQKVSSTVMSIQAGKDMYNEALANGFSAGGTKALYLANLLGLYAVHRTFGWMDDAFAASKIVKENTNIIKDTIAYSTKAAAKEGVKEVTPKMAARMYQNTIEGVKKFIIENGVGSSYPKAMMHEAAEEVAEMLSEETIKHVGNFMSFLGYGRLEEGEGRFKDMFDEGYWSEFGENLLASAVGGAVGGAIGKKFFHSNQQDDEVKTRLIDVITSGQDASFLQQLDKMHAEGSLGPKDLSTTFDKEAGTFKTMEVAGDDAISMNDANKQILLHEYNYLKSIVDKFGGGDAYKAMIEKNKELEGTLGEKVMKQDVMNLSQKWVKLVSENDLEEVKIQPMPKDLSEADQEEFIKKQARENGIEDLSVAKELVDIQTQIDDIHTGKAAEKYYIRTAAFGTIFDPKDPKNAEWVEKYGEDFLMHMMEASHRSAVAAQKKAEEIEQRIKDNDKIVNTLDKSLETLEDVEELFNVEGQLYLSEKAKAKIQKLAQSQDIDKSELDSVKEKIKEKLGGTGEYEASNIIKRPELKSLSESNPELANKIAKFAEYFYKAKLEKSIDNIKDLRGLLNFTYESVDTSTLLSRLASIEDDIFGGSIFTENSLNKLGVDQDEDIKALAEKTVNTILGNDSYIQSYNNITDAAGVLLDTTSSDVSSIVGNITDKLVRLDNLHRRAQNTLKEDAWKYDPTDVSYLMKGFRGDTDKVNDEKNLVVEANDIWKQYKADELMGEGTSTFNDVEGVEAVLEQVKARKAQHEFLLFLKGQEEKAVYGEADALSNYRVRQARINAEPSMSSEEIITEAIKQNEKDTHTKFFNDTSIDFLKYHYLKNKDTDSLNNEEKESLENLNSTFTQLADNLDKLANIEANLSKVYEDAKVNQTEAGVIAGQKSVMAKKIAEEIKVAESLVSFAKLDKQASPIISEAAEKFLTFVSSEEYNPRDNTKEGLRKNFEALREIRQVLRKLPESAKDLLTDVYFKAIDTDPDIKDQEQRRLLQYALITFNGTTNSEEENSDDKEEASGFNEDKFYSRYKDLIESGELGGVPTVWQENMALSVAAHMNSEISKKFQAYYDGDSPDTMFVRGIQGSGKSTFVLGVGLKIGLDIQADKYGVDNTQVILASNTQKQVDTLISTANDLNILGNVKTIGATKGITSSLKEGDVYARPYDLIGILEDQVNGKTNNLDDVSTIIFDEATYLQYEGLADRDSSYKDKSDLAKIFTLIEQINNKRGSDKPALRLILMGDPKQNGVVNEMGHTKNINDRSSKLFMPEPLTDNMRSTITSRNQYTDILTNPKNSLVSKAFTDYLPASVWGLISNEFDGERLGGIRIEPKEVDLWNDEELIENIRKQIEISLNSDRNGDFSIGVITETGAVDPDSLLGQLIDDDRYSSSFHQTTHDLVQGAEFDYVLMEVTNNDIGAEKDPEHAHLERARAKKFSTSIGRARYFTAILNKSDRQFKDSEMGAITLPPMKFTETAVKDVREAKVFMISGESLPMDIDDAAKETGENIQTTLEEKEEEKEYLKKKAEEEQAQEKIDLESEKIEAERNEKLQEIAGPEATLESKKLRSKEERNQFIEDKAKEVDPETTDIVLQDFEAEKTLQDSDSIAERVAARLHLEKGEAFNSGTIAVIEQAINEGNLDEETQKIYDEEELLLKANKTNKEEGGNSPQLQEELDSESEEELEEDLKKIKERSSKYANNTLSELEEMENELIIKYEHGKATKKELRDIRDAIADKMGKDINQARDLGNDEEETFNAILDNFVTVEKEEGNRDNDDDRKVMEALEDRGWIAAYSDNGGRGTGVEKRSSIDMDGDYLRTLYGGSVIIPKTDSAYRKHQLAAMGLQGSISDYSYELKAYINTGGLSPFLKTAIVATHRKTQEKVIIGGLNQIHRLKENGKKGAQLIELIESKLDDKDFSEQVPGATSMVRFKKGIPIKNPRQLLDFDMMSPGAIKRSSQSMTLRHFNNNVNIPNLHVSEVFAVTEKDSEFAGDGFLFYSFNDDYDFSDPNVIEKLITTRLSRISEEKENGRLLFKGYKGQIGVIRLDASPFKLQDLDDMIGEVFSEEATKLANVINKRSAQENMTVALAQIFYAARKIRGSEAGVSPKVIRLLDEKAADKSLEFNTKVLRDNLLKLEKRDPKTFDLMMKTLNSLFTDNQLGRPKSDGEGGWSFNRKGDRVNSAGGSNVINIIFADETGAEKNTIDFALHKFISEVRSKATLDKDVTPKDILGMMQTIMTSAGAKNLKNGAYLRPNIYRGNYDNKVFAKMLKTPFIEDSYEIKVADIKTPTLRVQIDKIGDLILNANSLITEEESSKQEEVNRKIEIEADTKAVRDVISNSKKSLEGHKTTSNLDKAYKSAKNDIEAKKVEVKKMTDFKVRDGLLEELRQAGEDLKIELKKRKKDIVKSSKEKTIEDDAVAIKSSFEEFIGPNKDKIEAEKAAIISAIENGKHPAQPDNSKLTEDDWLYTQTPSFKMWAGDSVLLDEETGEPRMFYHGSVVTNITQFDPSISKYGANRDVLGTWATSNENEALAFIGNQFDDPRNMREVFNLNNMPNDQFEHLHSIVNEYVGRKIAGQLDEMNEVDLKMAEQFISDNSRIYGVFVKGTVNKLGSTSEVNNVEDLFNENQDNLINSDKDITMFLNSTDSVTGIPSDIIAIKSGANAKIANGEIEPVVKEEEGDSPEFVKFKSDIANIVNHYTKMAPFIFSSEDLDNFKDDLESATTSMEATIASITEQGNVKLDTLNKLISDMRLALKKVENSVNTSNPDLIRNRIEKSLNNFIPINSLPVLENSSEDLSENRLSELMVKYHTAKVNNVDTTDISAEISKRYLKQELSGEQQFNELMEIPVSDKDSFTASYGMLNTLYESGKISKKLFDEGRQKMVTEFQALQKAAAVASEGLIDAEELSKIKDSNVQTILEGSTGKNLSPEAEEIINSTWGDVENFLSSDLINTVDNAAALENMLGNFELAKTKATAKFNAYAQFILDDNMRNKMQEKFNKTMSMAKLNVQTVADQRLKAQEEVGDLTEASEDNLFPASQKDVFTTDNFIKAESAVNALEAKDKATWIKAANGEIDPSNQKDMDATYDMQKAIKATVSPDVYNSIKKYLRDRTENKHKICKI